MTFNAQRNRFSFGRATAAVKSWIIGWTADEARPTAATQSEAKPRPGTYGLLVETRRR